MREAESLVRKIIDKKQPNKSKTSTDPDIQRLENQLTSQLGAKVTIKHKKSGAGILSIKYSSTDELEGILSKIKVIKKMNRARSPKEIALLILLAQTFAGVLLPIVFLFAGVLRAQDHHLLEAQLPF